jgi:hypothetical protein
MQNAVGQEYTEKPVYFDNSPVNIAKDEVKKEFIAPPSSFSRLKSASAKNAHFEVSYINFPEEAKIAFEHAVAIWESLLSSDVTIKVQANWEYMEGNLLGKGRPSIFFNNFAGSPLPNVYYPVALVEKLTGKEMNPGSFDIICNFNSKYSWYFGTDGNTPETKYDLVSSVMHEIAHGLGFSGFLNNSNNLGFFDNLNQLPSIYDVYIFNFKEQQIADKSLFRSPSKELHYQLISQQLKFLTPDKNVSNNNSVDKLYAPSVWNEGTSIYHLDGYSYGAENSLMSPFAYKGRAIHNPGEIIMNILSKLGWKSVTFDFEPLRDTEELITEIPVDAGIKSDLSDPLSSVKIIYSYDNFKTVDSVYLNLNQNTGRYSGKFPVNNKTATYQYFLKATTSNNMIFKYPADAPEKKFNLRIGPDYFIPDVFHNPVKIVFKNESSVKLSVIASDNVGVKSVIMDYKVDGVSQEPVQLIHTGNNKYETSVPLTDDLIKCNKLEYKITAFDIAANCNKRSVPSMGFFNIQLFEEYEPVTGYSTDFEEGIDDFILSDFIISNANGFTGSILHTSHPYPLSSLEYEHYNMTAILKHPIIVQDKGKISFNEVVLVENGISVNNSSGTNYTDFVVVEASKDAGITWLPLTNSYNSAEADSWDTAFKNNFTNNTSSGSGNEGLFINREINMTDNTGLNAGDIVLIRFRLASDRSINGWGWAIDNLKIQQINTYSNNIIADNQVSVYPNPFNNSFTIKTDNPLSTETSKIDLFITDISGKTILHKTGIETFNSSELNIDLTDKSPGLYLVNIRNSNGSVITNKIIKY